MDHFSVAHDVTFDLAKQLVDSGLDAEKVAEGMIVVGLSLWAVQSGRKDEAEGLLHAFDKARGS